MKKMQFFAFLWDCPGGSHFVPLRQEYTFRQDSDQAGIEEDDRKDAAGNPLDSGDTPDGTQALLEVQLGHGAGQPESGAVGMAERQTAGAHGQIAGEVGNAQDLQHRFAKCGSRRDSERIGTRRHTDQERDQQRDKDSGNVSVDNGLGQDLCRVCALDEGSQRTAESGDEDRTGRVDDSLGDPFVTDIHVREHAAQLHESRSKAADEQCGQRSSDKGRVCKIFCVNAKASCSKLIYNPY